MMNFFKTIAVFMLLCVCVVFGMDTLLDESENEYETN